MLLREGGWSSREEYRGDERPGKGKDVSQYGKQEGCRKIDVDYLQRSRIERRIEINFWRRDSFRHDDVKQ